MVVASNCSFPIIILIVVKREDNKLTAPTRTRTGSSSSSSNTTTTNWEKCGTLLLWQDCWCDEAEDSMCGLEDARHSSHTIPELPQSSVLPKQMEIGERRFSTTPIQTVPMWFVYAQWMKQKLGVLFCIDSRYVSLWSYVVICCCIRISSERCVSMKGWVHCTPHLFGSEVCVGCIYWQDIVESNMK